MKLAAPSPRSRRVAVVAALVALAGLAPAGAVDGVIEINLARALAGGVTAGDAPGFPVVIDRPGSYRLTGNLDVTDAPAPQNVTAIAITASFVTLDLNGFTLIGPTECTGSPVADCAPLGSGSGIQSSSSNLVRISNGVILGFGAYGILAGNATVDRVQAFSNGAGGISLGAGGAVTRSAGIGNGGHGISGAGILVDACRAAENHQVGIYALPGAVRNSEAVRNGSFGIYVGFGVALQSVARDNGDSCAFYALNGGYAGDYADGSSTLCGGVQLGANLCNGAVCP